MASAMHAKPDKQARRTKVFKGICLHIPARDIDSTECAATEQCKASSAQRQSGTHVAPGPCQPLCCSTLLKLCASNRKC